MTDAQKTYDHWGMTREEILDYAENDLRRLRKKEKESMGFPQDGSRYRRRRAHSSALSGPGGGLFSLARRRRAGPCYPDRGRS